MAKIFITDFTDEQAVQANKNPVTILDDLPVHDGPWHLDADQDKWWPSSKTGVNLKPGDVVHGNVSRILSLEDGTQVGIVQLNDGGWIASRYWDADNVLTEWAAGGQSGTDKWAAIQVKAEAKPSKTKLKTKAYVSKKTGKEIPAGTRTVELAGRSALAILVPLALAGGAAWLWTRRKRARA